MNFIIHIPELKNWKKLRKITKSKELPSSGGGGVGAFSCYFEHHFDCTAHVNVSTRSRTWLGESAIKRSK